jgi:hypothetical protein
MSYVYGLNRLASSASSDGEEHSASPYRGVRSYTDNAHLIHRRTYNPSWGGPKASPALAHKAGPHVQEASLSSFQPLKTLQG